MMLTSVLGIQIPIRTKWLFPPQLSNPIISMALEMAMDLARMGQLLIKPDLLPIVSSQCGLQMEYKALATTAATYHHSHKLQTADSLDPQVEQDQECRCVLRNTHKTQDH